MRTIGALVFPDFELLDLFGPLEMFGMLPEAFDIRLVAESSGPIGSAQGPRVLADNTFAAVDFDLLLIPGGAGTRHEINNPALLEWIEGAAANAEVITSVCTGSALLASTPILVGKRATTNKRAFEWVRSLAPTTDWARRARWVKDGNIYTASGVSAGIDMSIQVIADVCGPDVANQVCVWAEYRWNADPADDPFTI